MREPALWLALAAALVAALTWAWLRALGWLYRLKAPRPSRLTAVSVDGWRLAVYRRAPTVRRFVEPVVLCHGLAANHFFFDLEPPHSLAEHLAAAGFECFSVELRGTGGSASAGRWWQSYCVDDHITLDAPATLELALTQTGAPSAFWLGHSLGGLVGYGLAQGPYGGKLSGLLTLGAPAFFPQGSMLRRAVQLGLVAAWPFSLRQHLVARWLVPLAGRIALPMTELAANLRHITPRMQRLIVLHALSRVSRKTLLQLQDWALNDAFRSFDHRTDYREGIRRLSVPLLVMGGSQDRLCPPDAVTRQYELAGSSDKSCVVFGPARGDREEYGHGDLVFGAGAPDEVYPEILRWLEARATPVSGTDLRRTAQA